MHLIKEPRFSRRPGSGRRRPIADVEQARMSVRFLDATPPQLWPEVSHELGKLRAYLLPFADCAVGISVYLTVVRVPTCGRVIHAQESLKLGRVKVDLGDLPPTVVLPVLTEQRATPNTMRETTPNCAYKTPPIPSVPFLSTKC
jgi:hypothetical protein